MVDPAVNLTRLFRTCRPRHVSPALTAALLALAGSVRSQQPTPLVDARSFLLPIHTHQGGDDAGYGTWASGPAYKASFHEG